MHWMRHPSEAIRDVVAAILGALLVALVAALCVWPDLHHPTNWGFGPDWDCSANGKGEPICFQGP